MDDWTMMLTMVSITSCLSTKLLITDVLKCLVAPLSVLSVVCMNHLIPEGHFLCLTDNC
jgi:hypothetical protein